MLGFGALKAMNDTIKQNREMLKANKKAAFEKLGNHAKVSDNLLLNDKRMSEQDRLKLIHATWRSNREDSIRKIIVLIISAGIVGFLVWEVLRLFNSP